MSIGEIKAFVLLRQSNLQPEDGRRVITMTGGVLEVKRIEQSMRSLSTSIISGGEAKKKIYPVHFAQQEENDSMSGGSEDAFVTTEGDDSALEILLSEGDDDALLDQQYEDALIDTLQGDSEISARLNTYLEARRRLTEKARLLLAQKQG